MDWTWYLFGFDGRINRAKLWLGGLIILAWMLLVASIVTGVDRLLGGTTSFGFDSNDIFKVVDPAAWRALPSVHLPIFAIKAAGTALFVWVYLAMSVKRLHDRDKSAWWIVPFFVLPGLYNQFGARLPDSPADLPLALVAFGLCIWGFVELYCLAGSRKTNRFGANPLTPLPAQGGSRWEQHSEIEMVPYKAGPPPVCRVNRGA